MRPKAYFLPFCELFKRRSRFVKVVYFSRAGTLTYYRFRSSLVKHDNEIEANNLLPVARLKARRLTPQEGDLSSSTKAPSSYRACAALLCFCAAKIMQYFGIYTIYIVK